MEPGTSTTPWTVRSPALWCGSTSGRSGRATAACLPDGTSSYPSLLAQPGSHNSALMTTTLPSYLRDVRLARVRAGLLAAEPGGANVTDTATRWDSRAPAG